MSKNEPGWTLDSRLNADTYPIFEANNLQYLLMNDRRWPWIIIVPMVAGAEELHDLDERDYQTAVSAVFKASRILKTFFDCEKINTAALGNSVRQLHIHIVARNDGDANWPGPVWGFGEREAYEENEAHALVEKLKVKLIAPPVS